MYINILRLKINANMEEDLASPRQYMTNSIPNSLEKTPLDIPLPSEDTEVESSSSQVSPIKPTALGIENAKKRLKGFAIAKKALEAKSGDNELQIKTPFSSKKGVNSSQEKKKPKKGIIVFDAIKYK